MSVAYAVVDHAIQGIGSNAKAFDASESIAVDFGASVVPASLAVGEHHSCAIANGPTSKGGLYCWGYNIDGRLGIADRDNTQVRL
jgi:alpha-tubulin suppressor-like RCC1 family protein